jgi:NtrC-family two-component system sensor histidine kinase KinB
MTDMNEKPQDNRQDGVPDQTSDDEATAPSAGGPAPRTWFGLRRKLVLGFGGLLAILVALGLQSVALLTRLGGSIDVILRENYQSVVACEEMKEALERMDSAALFSLAGDAARGRTLAAANVPRFERALDLELHNITLPGEGKLAERLRQLYGQYRPTLERFLADEGPLPARRGVYFDRLLPLFGDIKATADEIQQLNQQNMVEANSRARALAARARRRMYLLLFLGAAVAAGFVAFLSRAILLPLRRLTQSARDIERGHLGVVVQVPSHDELGQLAEAFNAMASRLRELRRSNQARLLRAQRTSQLAIDSLIDAVAVFSPQGVVELANRAAISTLGLRPGEPLPERHAGWLQPLLDETARAGRLPERGYEAAVQLFQEGKERFYLPRAVAIRDDRDQILSITLILADVTELRRLDEMRSGVVRTVSHELRTPLTSLQMALHILLDESQGELNLRQAELLVAAREDAARLREIVDSLLEISRLELGRQLLHFEPVSPRDFIQSAAAELRSEFADAGVELQVEVDPRAARVLIDPARARLVLANLLTNALHHTPAGGSVTVAAEPQDGRVRLSVADTGDGFPPEAAEHVFDKFYQVPGTERLGAGLGLSIAREIVLAHGGEIHGESRAGQGATFWFTLPAEPAQMKTSAEPAQMKTSAPPAQVKTSAEPAQMHRAAEPAQTGTTAEPVPATHPAKPAAPGS